jgi:hypothetical protein
MGKANSPGNKINRTKDTFGVKGLKSGGSTDAYKTISAGKKFPTKNGGGRSSKKYC